MGSICTSYFPALRCCPRAGAAAQAFYICSAVTWCSLGPPFRPGAPSQCRAAGRIVDAVLIRFVSARGPFRYVCPPPRNDFATKSRNAKRTKSMQAGPAGWLRRGTYTARGCEVALAGPGGAAALGRRLDAQQPASRGRTRIHSNALLLFRLPARVRPASLPSYVLPRAAFNAS